MVYAPTGAWLGLRRAEVLRISSFTFLVSGDIVAFVMRLRACLENGIGARPISDRSARKAEFVSAATGDRSRSARSVAFSKHALGRFNLQVMGVGLGLWLGLVGHFEAAGAIPTGELPGLSYTNEFFPGATYDSAVPAPREVLGFDIGQRAATPSEIDRCLKAWSKRPRTRLVEYGRTHENRPLSYMIVTAPRNLERLDSIRGKMGKLADPRGLPAEAAEELIEGLPAIGWLAYTIHGDETEGSDAALAVLYHLTAATDSRTEQLLEQVVIIIDPVMNPDGRERFLKMVAEHRGRSPNVDNQSLLHEGYWPWGRGNHYLFDLNRDWIYAVHPETRGRIREIARWNPLLFVDAHGMGALDTHLFSPPRQPVNLHFPATHERWGKVFAEDQARAFDQQGWVYYHGEWNEGWYPGYSDAWAGFRGAIGILYEQATIAEDGVRREGGRILSYRESVHHHVVGTMANLETLKAQAKALLRDFLTARRTAVDPAGPYANRTFAILPTSNRSRLQALAEVAQLQGFEVYQNAKDFTSPLAVDQLGREVKAKVIAAGTLLIPNRQPLAHLLAAMFEFDPRIPTVALQDERQELLRKSRSRIYDTTAWNLTMMFGLEALVLPMELPESARAYVPAGSAAKGIAAKAASPLAYIVDGADDKSVAWAARLLERGVQVRVAEKAFRFDDQPFARGSVVVTALDNRLFQGNLARVLDMAAEELGLSAVAVGHGLGSDDYPDLGGKHFLRLEPIQLAVLSRGNISSSDFGSIWFALDEQLAIRHSHLDESSPGDLRRYNVIVIPNRSGSTLPSSLLSDLRTWVKSGGTLIAIDGAAEALATEKADLGKTRLLADVLGKLDVYEQALFREWRAQKEDLPGLDQIWSYKASPDLKYPWQIVDGAHPEEKELKKRDAWQKLFKPQGAILAGRLDRKHWLTFGCNEPLPLVIGEVPILMAADDVEAPVRLGFWTSAEKKPEPAPEPKNTPGDSKKEKKEPARVGWSALPEGQELHLRMSGLLWPEAAHRLANAAWMTREKVGRGQLILFASSPTFRAAARGSARVFLNAVVYGAGCGATHPIEP